MTSQELLREVRRFLPQARCGVVRGMLHIRLRGQGKLVLHEYSEIGIDGRVIVESGWWVALVYERYIRQISRPTIDQAMRALGFAERSPGAFCNKNRHRAEYIRQFDFVVTDFPLQSTQRPFKGARLGRRKREASDET